MSQICCGHFLALVCRQNNVGGSMAWTSLKEHVEFVREREKQKGVEVDFGMVWKDLHEIFVYISEVWSNV
ncbi:hypothetical protein VNO77_35215 [Canavalia gladiata]|uniref:Uncharacterized protein n=1 Tax=Canavalia gladiata TaxID=3824 RepID=A0AAN9KFV6_CANGL